MGLLLYTMNSHFQLPINNTNYQMKQYILYKRLKVCIQKLIIIKNNMAQLYSYKNIL